MAVVKGSKQEKMIVVPYRPWRVVFIRLGICAAMLVVAASFYLFGHFKGVTENDDARGTRDRLQTEVVQLNQDIGRLSQQIVNADQELMLSNQVLDEVQGTIVSLREQNAQLEEDVLFYKQVMSPENTETGLVIGQIDLIAAGQGAIRYRVEFKQIANNEEFITGYANVNILGKQAGSEVSLPLRSLSATENVLDIRLQFRYFQNIEGELILPDDFEPEKIQILAVSEGSNSKTVQKNFGWLVEG